jgi:branched-chain amino acid transport system permease protein
MILVVTAITLAALMWLVHRTKLGRAMRATAENPRVAALMGVQPDRVISATFVIGAVLAAIAGVMWASQLRHGAAQHGLSARAQGLHGGGARRHRQPRRRRGGRLLLGLIEALGAGYIGALTGGLLGSHYADIFAFVALILVLTLRPPACSVSAWPTAPEEGVAHAR